MLHHDHWATRRLIDACADLPDESLERRFDIGPGSVRATLVHIVGAMRRWADRIDERPVRPSIEAAPGPPRVQELRGLLDEAAADLRDVAGRLVEAGRLEELMQPAIRGWSDPQPFSRATALLHVATHGAHHRAQTLNMLRQLGATPPDVDAIEAELDTA
ncbi:MAG: DinB family protein [Planctomycetota bacterium]